MFVGGCSEDWSCHIEWSLKILPDFRQGQKFFVRILLLCLFFRWKPLFFYECKFVGTFSLRKKYLLSRVINKIDDEI